MASVLCITITGDRQRENPCLDLSRRATGLARFRTEIFLSTPDHNPRHANKDSLCSARSRLAAVHCRPLANDDADIPLQRGQALARWVCSLQFILAGLY